ncbi:MAG: response regulator [Rhodoplanes sp.]|uniref:ATP-binding protein n=1 Tax=Rhodoplanes sp. TaxID=1968906 RepID=UPI00180B5B35|nr:ATP-binding protein [Rhodoplanes sp.]NVO12514.1 response regulator [Rhodoplanes sp.]
MSRDPDTVPAVAARANFREIAPYAIAIGLFLAAIVGSAGFYAHELAHGKSSVVSVATDVKRHDLVRELDRYLAHILAGVTAVTIGFEEEERSAMVAGAVVDVRRMLALDSPLDRLIGVTGDVVSARDHLALWNAVVEIGESLDHFAAWEQIGATEEERSFHILRTYDNVRTARRVLGHIDDVLDDRIRATLESSAELFGAAVPTLWTIGLAGALIGAAVALFVLASIRRLQHTRHALESSEAELSEQNRLFKDALESMNQGLSMFDAERRLIVCNQRFVDLYGLHALAPRRGTRFDEIVRARRDLGLVVGPGSRLDREPTADTQWLETLADGRVIGINPRLNATGGWVCTHTDMTDLKRAEEQRARAEAESVRAREHERAAEVASKAKSAFFAVMSHEIRTPLNGLLGLAATLLETTLDTDQRKTLEAINQSGECLLAILNDILDLSKLEAGRVQFECVAFSPRELADDVVGVLGPQARAKGVALFLSVAGDVPPLMLGDPGRIRQVLLNLAGNAMKFTPTGGEIEVVVGCAGRAAGGATLEWAVHDSGIGIAPERIGTLFSDYVQADSSINRRFGGTGLGLAICKRLVEQMGGDVAVRSVLDEGSTFTVRLPLAVTDVPRDRGAGPVSHAAFTAVLGRLARPLRVLLVEDNGTNQMVVTRMLKSFDITIRIAEDGFQAVAAVSEFACDLILMDVRMPGMDGLEATRHIRARGGRWASMPIIALTANAFPDDVQACREAGMTGFIAKPVRKTVLIESLAQAVQAVAYMGLGVDDSDTAEPPRPVSQRAPRPAEFGRHGRAKEAGAHAGSSLPVLDLAATEILRDEIGDDGFAAALDCFLDDARRRLAVLRDLAAGADRKTLGIEAHTLKGSAGALGFRRLAELALALEKEADAITAARAADLTARLDDAFTEARSAAERLRDTHAA